MLEDIRETIREFRETHPDVFLFAAPPMFRRYPEWYHDNLSEILLQFSRVLSPLQSDAGFQLLPSFAGTDLEDDGVHLTPYAGLRFVVHLFDSSLDTIKAMSASLPEGLARVGESSRVLEDRVSVLEQDHRSFRQEFRLKMARDSELADFEENVRNECYFVISGLPQVPTDLVGRAWQDHARGLVQDKVKLILGRESKIIVVSGLRRDEKPVYLVKLESTADSKRIRDKFGSYFKAGASPLPPDLKGLSIRCRHTHATRVRLAIMQSLASNYKASNPGSKVQVVNYEPRPMMRLTPPADASDSRAMTFNFIEAVTKLPGRFSKKDLSYIMKQTSGKFKGQLRSLFVVISDDQRDQGGHQRDPNVDRQNRGAPRASRASRSPSSSSGSGSSVSDHEPAPPIDPSRRSSGSRMDTESTPAPATEIRGQPPSGRGSKRGHSSPTKSKSKSAKSRH